MNGVEDLVGIGSGSMASEVSSLSNGNPSLLYLGVYAPSMPASKYAVS
jgi:hypothetical protein